MSGEALLGAQRTRRARGGTGRVVHSMFANFEGHKCERACARFFHCDWDSYLQPKQTKQGRQHRFTTDLAYSPPGKAST